MRVCVIGAGVVGVTCTYLLARAGHEVVILDAREHPAEVSSFANGGQLSYSYVAPLAGPGVWPDLPRWLFKGDSPLRFRPRLDLQQWRWSLAFACASNQRASDASTAQMLTLSYLSRDVMRDLLQREAIEFGHVRNGKLIVYRDAALLEKARKLVQYQAAHGAAQQILTAAETLTIEPALKGLGQALAGAVYTPSEEAGDCRQFTQGVYDKLAAMPNVTTQMGGAVRRLRRKGSRIVAAETALGEVQADAFVVASGMGSRALLAPLGQQVPLYPLKGYSLSVPLADDDTSAPRISVTDYERRIVYARIGSVLRIAAMVDMGTGNADIDPRRIATLRAQTKELFPHLDVDAAVAWAGLRPATPSGRPIIGPSKTVDNLWLNLGQGALGFTLACGSAALLVAQLGAEVPPIDPAPFLPR